jgi:Flp pilus assembly CpaE family ATPase
MEQEHKNTVNLQGVPHKTTSLPLNETPLIAFVGTTPNIGTTLSAFAFAYGLAKQTTAQVAYLDLNLKSAKIHRYLGMDAPDYLLDSLRPELQTETLHPDKLRQVMHQVKDNSSLHLLFGNVMRDQAEYFTPQEINHLLGVATQTFDVVIADVSALWDNAATICALRKADTRIVVTTPALVHFQEDGRRWIKQMSPYFGIPKGSYELVVIHHLRTSMYQVRDVCHEMELPLLDEVKLSDKLFSALDSGTLDEWLTFDEQGKETLTDLLKKMTKRYDLELLPEYVTLPWYKRLRGGKVS